MRTWARLIREAEALWHVDVRALRRMGADELSQLIEEVPAPHRKRVNRWLRCYAVAQHGKSTVVPTASMRRGPPCGKVTVAFASALRSTSGRMEQITQTVLAHRVVSSLSVLLARRLWRQFQCVKP